jgi:hypothetical protein
MSFADGFRFGFHRRQAINMRKGRLTYEVQIEQLCAQVDSLIEVIKTIVPDADTRKNHLNPLYHKILSDECRKRNVPFPDF